MRKVVSQVREIRFQRFEIAVERCPEKNLKLCPVDLVTVNLLVIESYAAELVQRFSCPPCAVEHRWSMHGVRSAKS